MLQRAATRWDCERLEADRFWPAFRQRLQKLSPAQQRFSPLAILDGWEKAAQAVTPMDADTFIVKLAELCPGTLVGSLKEEYLDQFLDAVAGHPP